MNKIINMLRAMRKHHQLLLRSEREHVERLITNIARIVYKKEQKFDKIRQFAYVLRTEGKIFLFNTKWFRTWYN